MDTIQFRADIEQIVKHYAELLKEEMNIDSIYLFGSYVKGNYTEDSDIDIAVVTDEFTGDIVEDTLRLRRIRRKVDNRIEPHPFRSSDFKLDDPFVQEIINGGVKVPISSSHGTSAFGR